MTIPPPISAEARARIVDLAAAGLSRNAIAAEVGVARRTVTKYANAAGHSFDRAATRAATEAARIDNAAKRETLAADILTEVATTVSRLKTAPPPADSREAEQRARALAAVSRAFGDTTRAAPITPGDQNAEVREAVRAFTSSLTDIVAIQNKLDAYERRYGPIDDTPDTYGQAPADEHGREGSDDPEEAR